MGTAKYIKIKEDLKEKILKGEYKDLNKLPDEKTLIKIYEVSKLTVKKAVDELVAEGLVFKKQGSGTYINSTSGNRIFLNDFNVSNNQSLTYSNISSRVSSKVLEFKVVKATKALQSFLNLDPDDFLYKCVRVRYINDEPISLDTLYYPINIVTNMTIEVLEGSIYHHIKDVLKLSPKSYHQLISAEPSTELYWKELKLKKNEPVVVKEQVGYLDDGTPYEYSIDRFCYDKFKFKTISFL